jgi:DNA-binding MarR family transcriptional regulator
MKREAAFLFARVHQVAGRIFADILKEHDLADISPAQGRILFVLWNGDNIPIQELAKKTSLSKSTLTVMLDKLETRGHVRRIHSATDRREILIQLTEKDHALMGTYAKVSAEFARIACKGFTEAELDDLEEKLGRILKNLTAHEAETKKRER